LLAQEQIKIRLSDEKTKSYHIYSGAIVPVKNADKKYLLGFITAYIKIASIASFTSKPLSA
jgi:hypothetical protein